MCIRDRIFPGPLIVLFCLIYSTVQLYIGIYDLGNLEVSNELTNTLTMCTDEITQINQAAIGGRKIAGIWAYTPGREVHFKRLAILSTFLLSTNFCCICGLGCSAIKNACGYVE